jgi:hypothetical protein
MDVKTSRALFLRGNRSRHHNTELKKGKYVIDNMNNTNTTNICK